MREASAGLTFCRSADRVPFGSNGATQRVALKRGAEAPGPPNGRASAATASWATRNDRLFSIFRAPKLQASRGSYLVNAALLVAEPSRGDVERRGSRLLCSRQMRRATC